MILWNPTASQLVRHNTPRDCSDGGPCCYRVADTGANVGEPAARRTFLHCAAWQTLFAAAGAGSWLAWQHPDSVSGTLFSGGGSHSWSFGSGVSTSGLGSWSFGGGRRGSWAPWKLRSWGWRGVSGAWVPGRGLWHALSGHAWWQYLLAAAALLTIWLAMCRSSSVRLLASTAGLPDRMPPRQLPSSTDVSAAGLHAC